MFSRIKTDNFMIWLVLLMQLGFHTNTGYDDILSLVVSIFVLLYFIIISGKSGLVSLTPSGKEFIIWYSLVMGLCGISFVWATHGNKPFILETFANTFIPLVITFLCISIYLKRGNTGKSLITSMVTAEIFVTVRALINTNIASIFSENNTRLYGTGLGVNYNHFTTQFALVLCVVLFLAYNINKLFYIPAAFIVVNIIISGSRKVLVASLLTFLVMYIISPKGGKLAKKIRRVILVLAVFAFILWLILNNNFLYNLIGQKTVVAIKEMLSMQVDRKVDYSVYQRAEVMRIAFDVFKDHPVIGVGYYCFLNYNEWQLYAHNNYLELLADLGLIGFVLYYIFYVKNILGFMGLNIGFVGPKFSLSVDKNKSVWNVLGITLMITLLILEYGQVTFFRLYALIPLMVVILGIENMKNRKSEKRSLK